MFIIFLQAKETLAVYRIKVEKPPSNGELNEH